MEKMIWTRPEMNEFAFAANEYVSTCGKGKCTESAEDDYDIEGVGENLFKIFFKWFDNNGNNIVDFSNNEVLLNKENAVCWDNDGACDSPYESKDTSKWTHVVTPDNIYFYEENDEWKTTQTIDGSTKWIDAWHVPYNKDPHDDDDCSGHLLTGVTFSNKS